MSCTAPCPTTVILTFNEFNSIANEWQRLLERSYDNRVFMTHWWHRTWWHHFGRSELRIFACRNEDGTLSALLPLQKIVDRGDSVLTLLGDHNVSDYMDGIAERAGARQLLEELWCRVLSDEPWDRVDLRHVPAASPLIPALQSAAEGLGFSASIVDDEVSPVAILCSSWEGYLEMLSKKQRHEIRRKLRRAQDGADWSWRTARTPEELEADLPVYFRLHEASAGEKAGFLTGDMRTFFHDVAVELLTRDMLRLSVFRRDGVDIAATMSFLYNDRYLLYNSGYDPQYAPHSPGIASVALAMQDAIASDAVAFDFLSGNEPYKYQFGASNTYTCRVQVVRR